MRRVGVLLAVLFALGPFAWIVATSLKSPEDVAARPPTLVPDVSLTSYETVFREHDFLRYATNSLVVATVTTVVTILLAALAAYPLARMPALRGRGVILGGVLVASMFPQVAIVGGAYRMLLDLGLLNTVPGIVLPYTALALPLAIWLLVAYFREIPRALEEAALIDGGGRLTVLVRIFLPVAAPAVATTAILVFVQTWNEFFFALLILTDPAVQTLPVGIALFPGEHEIPWGELAAAGVLATLPLCLLVLGLQRRIVGGLTAGSVKG